MHTPHPSFLQLLRFIFPAELLEHFEITGMRETVHAKTGDVTLTIRLEEKNTPPVISAEHRGKRILSKGFHRPLTVQDFPLRDKLCHLEIHRRRWEIEGGGTMERDLAFLPLAGLKITTTFGDFLKEADRIGTGRDLAHRQVVPGRAIEYALPGFPVGLRSAGRPRGIVPSGESGQAIGAR